MGEVVEAEDGLCVKLNPSKISASWAWQILNAERSPSLNLSMTSVRISTLVRTFFQQTVTSARRSRLYTNATTCYPASKQLTKSSKPRRKEPSFLPRRKTSFPRKEPSFRRARRQKDLLKIRRRLNLTQ